MDHKDQNIESAKVQLIEAPTYSQKVSKSARQIAQLKSQTYTPLFSVASNVESTDLGETRIVNTHNAHFMKYQVNPNNVKSIRSCHNKENEAGSEGLGTATCICTVAAIIQNVLITIDNTQQNRTTKRQQSAF